MSKERARRREAREREAAIRRAAHAREVERRAQRRSRRDAVRKWLVPFTTGRQTGILARKRRTRLQLVLATLLLAQVVVWVVRPDWEARFAALLVAAVVFPVVAAFTL